MIHQYKLNGYNIVLDVYSGSVHAVDDVAYDAIALLDAGNSRPATAAALAERYADRPEVTPPILRIALQTLTSSRRPASSRAGCV